MKTSAQARSAMIWGLGLIALAAIVGPSLAQQADPNARQAGTANADTASAAPATRVIPPATIGIIDMDSVFKNYKRSQIENDAFAKANEAEELKVQQSAAAMQQELQKLQKLQPNSPDHKKLEGTLLEMDAKHKALIAVAKHDLGQRQAATWLSLYNEVQRMTEAVAKSKKLTMVVQTSYEKPNVDEPNTVMATMARPVIYADSRTDITNDVVYNLNYYFEKNKSVAGPKN